MDEKLLLVTLACKTHFASTLIHIEFSQFPLPPRTRVNKSPAFIEFLSPTKEKQRNSSLETVTFVICVAVLNSFGSEVTVIGRFERHKGGAGCVGV